MMINVMMPIISFKVEETLHWFEVRSDQSWERDPKKAKYKTKCT
jgi:hypothetical protein